MEKTKRMITETLERLPFERIIKDVFSRYKDNLMCSGDTIESITNDATIRIREQLQGMTRKELT